MKLTGTTRTLDAARVALLAYVRAAHEPRGLIDAVTPLSPAAEDDAIKLLDAAGVVDAMLDSDMAGNRRWRVRQVTSVGHDVARLMTDELVWAVLRDDLAKHADPLGHLVRKSSEAFLID
jgi:hypothetical protein